MNEFEVVIIGYTVMSFDPSEGVQLLEFFSSWQDADAWIEKQADEGEDINGLFVVNILSKREV